MNQHRTIKLLFVLAFLLSSILRLGFALVNRNVDDVVTIMLRERRLPLQGECEECFHPKVYYFTVAAALELARVDPGHQNSISLATHLINFAAGEVTLLVAVAAIRRFQSGWERSGLLAFTLCAFNPTLIAANAGGNNNAFVIPLSSLAIYFFWIFLQEQRIASLTAAGLFMALALGTKANAWCTALAIFLTLGLKTVRERQWAGYRTALIFTLAVLLGVFFNPLSQYLVNLQQSGTPLAENQHAEPFPSFFEKTYVRRPGIVSIQDGLLTFKLIELLRYPRWTLGATGYPAHRTSLWTELYGSANSIHFFNTPEAWHTRPFFAVQRAIYVLVLLPAAVLVFGMFSSLIALLKGVLSKSDDLLRERAYGLFDILAAGYVLFSIVFVLRYRDFAYLNAIYLYPGILAFLLLFLQALKRLYGFLSGRGMWTLVLFEAAMLFLAGMYAVDVAHMIAHLYRLNIL